MSFFNNVKLDGVVTFDNEWRSFWSQDFLQEIRNHPVERERAKMMADAFNFARSKLRPRDAARATKSILDEGDRSVHRAQPQHRASMAEYLEIIRSEALLPVNHRKPDELDRWVAAPKRLEFNAHSRLHKFLEAMADDRLRIFQEEAECLIKHRPQEAVPFVVQHDWARAFAGAAGLHEHDEVQTPFDHNAFEFILAGRPVISFVSRVDDLPILTLCEHNDTWYGCTELVAGTVQLGVEATARNQINAICVALDAEVAVKESVRAPERLNRQRVKKGRLPLKDYHVIKLNRRARTEPLPREPFAEPSHHKRMHFVRGHWRHFENHKTWIKWHLRGDPDLGFIDKEYRL